MNAHNDIAVFKERLKELPVDWEGRTSILELKEVDYNWRQMEWWAFYFEYKATELLKGACQVPGDRFNNVEFDLKTTINWDLKAKAIKSDDTKVILNDIEAMKQSIADHGSHGEIIALCDVEYNDDDRSFQKWHSDLKGGLSKYEEKRRARTSNSRYRKTHAQLAEILFVILEDKDLGSLMEMRQGRNSNDTTRRPKFMLDLDSIGDFYYERLEF